MKALSLAAKPLDCGRYANRNQPVTQTQRSKNRCLVTAFRKGTRATLVTVRATVEGDPVTTYYRVLGVPRLEMIVDARRDRFGGPAGWYRYVCSALSAAADYRHFWPDRWRSAPLPRTLPPRWP